MKSKGVIYTVNTGGYDYLREPKFKPKGFDFVCFTDDHNLKSRNWKITKIEVWNNDNQRTSRLYKILPHRFLGDYEYSVYIDANITVRGDVNDLIENYLNKSNMATFSHSELPDNDSSVYEHAAKLSKGVNGNFKDDPAVIEKQIEEYRKNGFPDKGGLISGMIILRRHNKADVVKTMEDWWQEVKGKSKRDQLSFNYVAWKNSFSHIYIPGNSRNNPYFLHTTHVKPTIRGRLRWLFLKKIPKTLGYA